MKKVIYLSILLLSMVLIFTSCKKENVAPDPTTQPINAKTSNPAIDAKSLQAKNPDLANLTPLDANYPKLYIKIVGDTLIQTILNNAGYKHVTPYDSIVEPPHINKYTSIIVNAETVEFQDSMKTVLSDGRIITVHVNKTIWYYWKTDSTIKLSKSNTMDKNHINDQSFTEKINR